MLKDRLPELRKKKGLTQVEFAREFKISNGTIGMWETGRREPDFDTLKRLAGFFDVTTDFLLGVEVSAPKEPPTSIPARLDRAEFEGLTPDEVDRLAEFAKFIKSLR